MVQSLKDYYAFTKCHNRTCTNIEHLYLGTHKDNTRDMLKANRRNTCMQKSKNAKLKYRKGKIN